MEQGCLLASCIIEREKFHPGPGLEPGPIALSADTLTTELFKASTGQLSGQSISM